MLIEIIKKTIYTKKSKLRASQNYILVKKKNNLNSLNSLKELIVNIISKDKTLYDIEKNTCLLKNHVYKRIYKLLINKHFNFFFYFFYSKKFIYPLPSKWIYGIRGHIDINIFFSKLLFICIGLLCFIKDFFKCFKIIIFSNCTFKKNSIFIPTIPYKNDLIYKEHFSHLCNYFDEINNFKIKNIYFNKIYDQNLFNKFLFFHTRGLEYFRISLIEKVKLVLILFKISIKKFFSLNSDLLFSLLDDFLYLKFKTYFKNNNLFHTYLHLNVYGFSYTPIWFNFVKYDSTIYNYSFSFDNYFDKSNKNFLTHGIDLSSWENYVVWNNAQASFLDKLNGKKKNYIKKKPFYFNANKYQTIIHDKSIVIVDTYPLKIEELLMAGLNSNYPSVSTSIKFIKDITLYAKEMNLKVYHKRKRSSSIVHCHKRYLHFLKSIEKNDFYYVLPDEIDNNILFNKNLFFICKPFTTFALIADYYKENVIFYDCTKTLLPNKYINYSVPLINDLNKIS